MFCPNCGTDAGNSKFCPNCGTQLIKQREKSTPRSLFAGEGARHNGNAGKTQPPLYPYPPNNQKPPKKLSSDGWVWWVLFGFFALSALVFIMSPASIFFIIAAVLLFPKGPIHKFFKQGSKTQFMQVISVVLCALIGGGLIPSDDPEIVPPGSVPSSQYSISSSAESQTLIQSSIPASSDALSESMRSVASSVSVAPSSISISSEGVGTAENTHEDPVAQPSVAPPQDSYASAAQEIVEEPTGNVTDGVMVWIAGSGNGTKYHRNPNCSNMNNPVQISLEDAKARGYTSCKKC